MDKSIELTPSQIKALENGATMFMFPIVQKDKDEDEYLIKIIGNNMHGIIEKNKRVYKFKQPIKDFIKHKFHIQKGDKNIFVKEKFVECGDKIYRVGEHSLFDNDDYTNASEMTKEQSRYSFSECIDVKVVKPQDDITPKEMEKIIGSNYINSGNSICIEDLNILLADFKNFYNQQMQELNLNKTYKNNDYVFLIEFKKR